MATRKNARKGASRPKSNDITPADATRADFNSPTVAAVYERFLTMLTLSSGPDRFKAMSLRREKGVEAAVEFLNECNVSQELLQQTAVDSAQAAGDSRALRDRAEETIERSLAEIHAIADLLTIASEVTSTFCDGTQETLADMLLRKAKAARDAREWLGTQVGAA